MIGTLDCRGRILEYGRRTLVVGIINVTPDSFSGDGLALDLDAIVRQARRMVDEGADLLDIGGESTRPSAKPVDPRIERDRVIPTIVALAAAVEVPLSVDTRKAVVAEAALRSGAHLINDVGGLRSDPAMAHVIANYGAATILMHSPGLPWEIVWPAHYDDVVNEVKAYLATTVDIATRNGIRSDQIVLDPGFGFGKDLDDNLALLRRLDEFQTLGMPLLIGTSRKKTIGRILNLPVGERLEGSLASVALAIARGVDFVRVHDVQATVRAARVADAIVRGTHFAYDSDRT